MKPYLALTVAAVAGLLALHPFPLEAREMEANGQPMTPRSAADLQAAAVNAAEIQGAKLEDPQGQEIGSVKELVIDTAEGKLAYLVVQASPAAGRGEVLVPWKAVRPRAAGEGQEMVLVVTIPQEILQEAPQGDLETVSDREQGRRIHQFFGVTPYWEESQPMPQTPPAGPLPPGHPPVLPPGHPPVSPPGDLPQGHPPVSPQGERSR